MKHLNENEPQAKRVHIMDVLFGSGCTIVKAETEGKVFQEKDFAKDWESVYVHPKELENATVSKGMRKITDYVLLITTKKPSMAFIMASEEQPVYIESGYKASETFGYTLALRVRPVIYPEYFYYLCKYAYWSRITGSLNDDVDGYDDGTLSWSKVGEPLGDGDYITAEMVLANCLTILELPPLSEQEQIIKDARSMEQMIKNKYSQKNNTLQFEP